MIEQQHYNDIVKQHFETDHRLRKYSESALKRGLDGIMCLHGRFAPIAQISPYSLDGETLSAWVMETRDNELTQHRQQSFKRQLEKRKVDYDIIVETHNEIGVRFKIKDLKKICTTLKIPLKSALKAEMMKRMNRMRGGKSG